MSRRNPKSALAPGVFEETFSSGVLSGSNWALSAAAAPGSDVGAYNHLGWFSPENVTLDEGVLALKLNQVGTTSGGTWNASTNTPALASGTGIFGRYYTVSTNGSTNLDGITSWTTADKALFDGSVWRKVTTVPAYVSSGAEVTSVQSYGYGTYEYIIKPSSSSPTPTTGGNPITGSTSEISVYAAGTNLNFKVEAKPELDLRNYIQLLASSAGGSTEVDAATANPETSFSTLKYIWSPGRVEFFVNGKLITVVTSNVPTTSGVIRFQHYGSNSTAIGGLATTGTERTMYVSYAKFTPPEGTKFFGFDVARTTTIGFSLAQEAAPGTSVSFAFDVARQVTINAILNTSTGGSGVTKTFNFDVNRTTAIGFAVDTAQSQVGLSKSFAFNVAKQTGIGFTVNTSGGGVATTTGWLNPVAVANTGWVNATNLFASDDARMTYTCAPSTETPEIFAYGFTGLNIPEGSVIDGIQVKIEGVVSAGSVDYSYIRLINQSTFEPKSAGEKTVTLSSGSSTPTDTGLEAAGTQVMTGWTNPANALVQDGSNASVAVTAAETPYAILSNFGLSIPSTATINGIELRVNGRSTAAGDYSYFSIGDVMNGTPYSTNQRTCTLPVHASTNGWVTLGGPTDLWGNQAGGAPWTPAFLNSANFGLAGAWGTTAANTYYVDGVELKVYYTPAGGTETATTIGGTTDLWGNVDTNGDNVYERLWAATDFSQNFAVWGAFGAGVDGATIGIDNIQLNVSFTTPGTFNGTPPVSTDTGWVAPTSNANDVGWTNPQNVYGAGEATASFTAGETPYLRYKGFTGLTVIPSDATIDGIELKVTGRTSAAQDYSYLFVGDVVTGIPQAVTAQSCPLPVHASVNGDVLVGGSTNLWGGADTPAPWAPADVTDADFGVSGAWGTTAANTVNLDSLFMKVYYTTAGTGSPPPPGPPPPGPAPAPGVIALPTKILGTYLSPYGGGGDVAMGNTMAQLVTQKYNQVHLFHAVPWSGAWPNETGTVLLEQQWSLWITAARVQALRSAGIRCIMVVGGAGWQMRFDSTAKENNFMASIDTLYQQLGGFDGIDFNTFEAGLFTQPSSNMISLSQKLKTAYGSNFSISAPPAHYSATDMALISAWNAASSGALFDFVTPQIYDDRSGPGASIYTQSVLYNATTKWIPYVGNLASKVTMGTGSNFYWGASTASNVAAWNQMKNGGASTYVRGVVGWSTVDDQNAASPWSFANALKPIL